MNPPNPPAPAKSRACAPVTPSDSTGTLPPAWAVEAAERIVPAQTVFDAEYRGHTVERVAAIIASHAPAPIYTGPCSQHYEKLTAEVLELRKLKAAPPPVPVSPPCKEREELVKRLETLKDELRHCHVPSGTWQALTDAISALRGTLP